MILRALPTQFSLWILPEPVKGTHKSDGTQVVSRLVWKRELAHSSGGLTIIYGPSCRTASGGTRHAAVPQRRLVDRGHAQEQSGGLANAPLSDLEFAYAYLDALALRVRSGGKVVSVPVLAVVGVLADGQKVLVELELRGGESYEAWRGAWTASARGG